MAWDLVLPTLVGTVGAAIVIAALKRLVKLYKEASYFHTAIITYIYCFLAAIGTLLWAVTRELPTWGYIVMLILTLLDAIGAFLIFYRALSGLKKTLKTIDEYVAAKNAYENCEKEFDVKH